MMDLVPDPWSPELMQETASDLIAKDRAAFVTDYDFYNATEPFQLSYWFALRHHLDAPRSS